MLQRVLKPNVILGAVTVVFALVLLLLWIPNDIDGDLINVVRRRASIGDPLAPTMTGFLVLFSGVMLVATGLFQPVGKEAFSLGNLIFLICTALFCTVFVSLMLFTGPVLVAVFNVAEDYRQARALVPWKFTGYLLGGFVLVVGLVGAVERRVSRRTLVLAVLVPLVIALLYDLPFDDTLLPPNGDY